MAQLFTPIISFQLVWRKLSSNLSQGNLFLPDHGKKYRWRNRTSEEIKLDRFGGIVAGNNGSQIYDFKITFELTMFIFLTQLWLKCSKTFMKIGQYKCHFFADDETFVYGPGDNSRYWSDVMHVKYNVVASLDMITKPITHLTIILSKSATPADIKNFYKEFNDLNENIDIIQYTKRVYEVCVKGINKGFAVEKICEYLGIDKTKTKSYALVIAITILNYFHHLIME
jgi:hydroxymethylpyrimidine pyrophosphatase-like HAD family hydrolase